jgi:hypothetical protein
MNRPSGVIPISGFESLRTSWPKVRAHGKALYGLLLYHGSDLHFPEYVAANGLSALHLYLGDRCALFVIHSPSQAYIDYAREKSTLWAKLFDLAGLDPAIAEVPRVANEPLLVIDGERRSMHQLLTPSKNEYLLADEIRAILRHFGCQPAEHPCLMFFTDLNADQFWFVDLRLWLGWRLDALEIAFRNYFEGAEFSSLVVER